MDKETSELIEKIEGTPMTTEAQIALAREIAGRVYRDIHCDPDFANAVEAGEADGDEAVQAALVAIQATEGKIAEWLRQLAVTHRSQWALSVDPHRMAIAEAIERGDHLHPHKEG